MRFLFDQNISQRILRLLPVLFNGSTHVKQEGLLNALDIHIWEYAKSHVAAGAMLCLYLRSQGWIVTKQGIRIRPALHPLHLKRVLSQNSEEVYSR
jgi:hypothetical protein